MVGCCEEIFLGAGEPGAGVVAGEGRRGVSTKAYVSGEKTCVDHGFKIPFVDGGEYVDAGAATDQLTTCWAFIQIKHETPQGKVALLERGGLVRRGIEEN